MKILIVNLVFLVTASISGQVFADSALYEPCVACHGKQAQGLKLFGAPRLAGQNEAYLVDQLRNFRSGARGAHVDDVQGQVMAANAKNLNDRDIERLTQFLAQIQVEKTVSSEGDINRGKRIYAENCLACHGIDGEGVTPLYTPNLRILSASYLERQLEAYRKGWRGDSEQGTTRAKGMRAIVTQVHDESDLEDLIAFLVKVQPR
jgi:cytochrome c oxidase subunit 2